MVVEVFGDGHGVGGRKWWKNMVMMEVLMMEVVAAVLNSSGDVGGDIW